MHHLSVEASLQTNNYHNVVSTLMELRAKPRLGNHSLCMTADMQRGRIRGSFRIDTDLDSKEAVGIQEDVGELETKVTTQTKRTV